jgi:hypothetical protein
MRPCMQCTRSLHAKPKAQERYLDEYVEASGIKDDSDGPSTVTFLALILVLSGHAATKMPDTCQPFMYDSLILRLGDSKVT